MIGTKSPPRHFYSQFFSLQIKSLIDLGGFSLLKTYKSLPQLLSAAYPEHNWELNTKNNFNAKSQSLLKTMLKTIIPQEGNDEYSNHSHNCRTSTRV
jgi:hypothetical protein